MRHAEKRNQWTGYQSRHPMNKAAIPQPNRRELPKTSPADAPNREGNGKSARVQPSLQPPQPVLADAEPRHRGRWWRRSLLFLVGSIVLLGVLGQWTYYHIHHVVAHQAMVKGVVSRVGARIAGRVAETFVQPNQHVRKGDVLAQLEDDHLKASVESARADLVKAQLEEQVARKQLQLDRERLALKLNLAAADLRAAEAAVQDAQVQWQRWKRERDRVESLRIANVVTASEKDQIITSEQSKAAALVAAKERREAAQLEQKLAEKAIEELTVTEARLEVLQKGVEVAQAQLKTVEADLDSTVIRAPQEGWVARQLVEAGGSVRVGDQVVALWAGDQLWIEAWVDESDLGNIKVGSPVDVYLAAYPNQILPGRVEALGVLSDGEFLAAALDRPVVPTNNSLLTPPTNVAARISLVNSKVRLMPGLTAMVGIHSGKRNLAQQWLPVSIASSITSWWESLPGVQRHAEQNSN
jgi:membrane fusion protein, multidrug efflux system